LLDALLVHPLVERISPPDAALVRHADLAAVAPPPESPEPTGEAIGWVSSRPLAPPSSRMLAPRIGGQAGKRPTRRASPFHQRGWTSPRPGRVECWP
jgi:hypothetical protein